MKDNVLGYYAAEEHGSRAVPNAVQVVADGRNAANGDSQTQPENKERDLDHDKNYSPDANLRRAR